MSTLGKILRFAFWAPFLAAGGFFVFSLPPVFSLRWADPVRTAFMWQRPGPVAQVWTPLKRISPALMSAVVSAEDANFYEHRGVDFREMRDSLKKNHKKKKYARGFSTITMQLAKNLYFTPHKTLVRKGLEIAVAFEMELLLSKDRILELYLNLVEWGSGVYGAEAASRHFFKRSAGSLTSEQAAFLASILPNPRKWGRWPPGPHVRKRMGVLMGYMGLSGQAKGPKPALPELPELPEETENGAIGPPSGSPPGGGGRLEPIPEDL